MSLILTSIVAVEGIALIILAVVVVWDAIDYLRGKTP